MIGNHKMLFRLEAIEHHRGGICGEMTLPVPLPVTATTLFLAICLAVLAAFLAAGTYTRKAHVSGFLAPQRGVARILPRLAGTILAVHVHEGDLVRAGDRLLTLGAGHANGRGQDVDEEVLENLQRQAASLRDQETLEQQRTARQSAAADDTIKALEQTVEALQAEHAIQQQRLSIAQRDLQASEGLLARAEMSPLEGRRREDAYLAQRQAESGMARAILDKRAELNRLGRDAADIVPAGAQRLAVLRGSQAEIAARIAELEGQHATLITAPVAGRVSALQAWVGRDADPAMPLMSIVPEGDEMEAQLLVPARAVGFVRPGQAVRLSYDTYPYQQYGFAEGRVVNVARTSLKPGEMAGPLEAEAAAFRVTVRLARQTIFVGGAEVALPPDTRLQADIFLARRNLLAWLIDPLRAAGARL
jgi:membrane fusion protein